MFLCSSAEMQGLTVSAIWVAMFATTFHVVLSSSWLSKVAAALLCTIVASVLMKAGAALLFPRRFVSDDREQRSKLAVFITGCDSGFGNLCARRLDALGFRVFAGCLAASSPAARDLSAGTSNRLQLVQCNVTDEKQVAEATDTVKVSLQDSRLISLINNAGITSVSFVELTPVEQYRRLLEVNCLGAVRVTQAMLPLLSQSAGHGQVTNHMSSRVVFVSSISGNNFIPYISAYSMSKAALNAFAGVLRKEIGRFNVSTHVISPPGYRTALTETGTIDRLLTENWSRCKEEVKQRYTHELFQSSKEKYLTFLEKALLPASRSGEVVDDMIDAAVGLRPQMLYVPSVGAKLRSWVYPLLPVCVLDWLVTNVAQLD